LAFIFAFPLKMCSIVGLFWVQTSDVLQLMISNHLEELKCVWNESRNESTETQYVREWMNAAEKGMALGLFTCT